MIDNDLCIAQYRHMTQTTDQAPPDLIGSVDACDLLHIDRSTLSRWVALGKITPAMRLPGRRGAFLFRREDIAAAARGAAA